MRNHIKLLLAPLMIFSAVASADFINPMDFDGSEVEKKKVIEYIKKNVNDTYCKSGLDACQQSTLRMMENSNINAFKDLSSATDRPIMDKVITTYCNGPIAMCSYTTIKMMYDNELKASKKELTW